MNSIDELLAIKAIERTKARYCRFLDTKNWTAWGMLFTADATLDVSEDAAPGQHLAQGRMNIVEFVRKSVADARTAHQVHAPEIEFQSPTSARVIWAMHDYLTWPQDGLRPVADMHTLQGFGHYHETYLIEDGEWRIATIKLTRLQRIIN